MFVVLVDRAGVKLGKIQGGLERYTTLRQLLKNVHLLAFLRKTIKKDQFLDFYAIKKSTF